MLQQDIKFLILDRTLFRRAINNLGLVFPFKVPVQSGLFYLIYRQRYLRRWAPEMFAGRVVTLAALPAGNGDETESEGTHPCSQGFALSCILKGAEEKSRCVPQLFLGSLLGTRQ